MNSLEEHQQQQPIQVQPKTNWLSASLEHKSRALVAFVERNEGARVYFSAHTEARRITYVKRYLDESYNKQEMLNIIKESYFPVLLREFAKWERGNGRRLTNAEIQAFKAPEVLQTTSELLLYWIEHENTILRKEYQESRFRTTFGFS